MTNFSTLGRLVKLAGELSNDRLEELKKLADLMDGTDGPAWKAYLARIREGGLPEKPTANAYEVSYTIVERTELDSYGAMMTKSCFENKCYGNRQSIYAVLPVFQPAVRACAIATVCFKEAFHFIKVAQFVLGTTKTSLKTLGEMLIAGECTMTLLQVDAMVKMTNEGRVTGMKADGDANFFFVETGDPQMPVSVGLVRRDGKKWGAEPRKLNAVGGFHTGHRFLIRNMGA